MNKYLIGVAGIAILGGVLFGIYKYQSSKIEALTAANITLQQNYEVRVAQVDGLLEQVARIEASVENNRKLTQEYQAEQEAHRLDIANKFEVFEKEEGRLQSLAAKKPGLIQNRVNKATIKVFEEIEKETEEFKGREE